MTDFRALCSRMADELDHYRQLLMDDRRATHALATEARWFLAQPEPPGPTDEEIDDISDGTAWYGSPCPAAPVVQAIKRSVSSGLKPGWHTAMISFELDEKGNLLHIDEYKVSSFGDDKP
jgi:hypothetical protein